MWQFETNRRLTIFGGIIAAVIGLLVLRLAWMQLLHGPQYKKQADENRVRQRTEYAPRGEIRDRHGAVLVASRPSFAVSIIPAEFTNRAATSEILVAATGIQSEIINAKLKEGEKFPYTPIRLKHDLDSAVLAKIEERKRDLPGVIIEPIAVRHYIYGQLAAHLFGYVGGISEEEYAKRKNAGYSPQDRIGLTGLERLREDRLRGINGGWQVEINAEGNEVRRLGESPTTPGHTLLLTLDANLQKAAEDALELQVNTSRRIGEPAKGGAVVVLSTRTGGVLALASNPAYDPNLFADGLNDKEWNSIIKNPNNPLTNRATSGVYPPASVFKIVTAAAALDTGLTTETEIFDDKGVYSLSGWKFFGWNTKGLGRLNIAGALAMSSDPVFYELGHRLGADTLASYALTFGYGKASGIELPEEHGLVPTEEWKVNTYGEQWYPGETLIAAIGQGYYLATPLQQAMLLQAVANGGIAYRPMIVEKILSPQGVVVETFLPEVSRTLYLKPESWETIRKGLVEVTTSGTASAVFKGFPHTVAGKTGSAETGRKATHAWFACYAPAEAPEVAVVAFVEDGGEGSVAAAPIARKVLEAYFGIPSAGQPPTPPKGTTD
ncbi:peptidoglycan glycosyltransferase [Anaerosporomusa subterranea]|uniref:Peptidoglycan glycosyltransferase n=1 Tax=Anaerosporomusa subterranea TaxID=1794912 RepID=A0A154BLY0_ANASB|nr:penicillin-binding protein 2 [Anaerosporomusa subterranea]KYZ74979.1 peptidoglycan glycosyltransferase [Anaerosporomusa subterranea]